MSHRVLGAPCVSQGMPRDGRAPAMFRYGTPGPQANGLPKEPVASFRLAPEHAQMCVMYFVTR